ncbi:transcription antiterminator BglG [Marinilactibacillus sp. 15R]|uniref:Transcriptional regulatory protein LevR, contains PRD, AAA+ and EIIA domains n=1 Tax=Marinilactibacillus piezotolerans TaxID=258723 RepID=A0A1I3Y1J3_9LACT|nr:MULTISPECIES: sigma-54-dependent transcriptional regulator [Marinilactibacillus]API90004.1 transcription antiterminator BglG [Marinilactibacillus sp. 15R]SFK25632.1 Transcriptional regulatory protein LevR, contains PRD, AAA+ and EIIA domains [Marinilactibacillus piezotolerans]
MKRIERIYEYVINNTKYYSKKELELKQGITTKEISDALDIQRSNVSKDLNLLVREGKLYKVEGRPVKYIDIKLMQHKPFSKYVSSYKETRPEDIETDQGIHDFAFSSDEDIFQTTIGATGSMKNAVEQAKAAVLYPPKGLNTLITGPTGSGKSFFAHAMFRFAQSNGMIDHSKELIVFNCADYAHNPQLLMSHLFGYSKGAFTGAMADKSGLIQQADGSMLFLDEIHRLPPEGQEMIFYFMDHGTYNRMGETGKAKQASVRIVGATTEDPGSALLDTFMRRIPINIHLPSFKQRPANEQIDLVKLMAGIEANRIQRRISLTEDVVKALITSVNYGNVGQLKSNIQLVCARGFMHQMQKEEVNLTVNDLPDGIKAGLIQLSSDRKRHTELSKYLEPEISVSPNESFVKMTTDAYELPYNLYDIIGDKAALLKAEGLDQESINHYISTDINVHLKSYYRNHGFSFNTESKLAEFVNTEVIQLTRTLYDLVKRRLGAEFQQNFIYAMSLHISSFLKKIFLGEERNINHNIKEMAIDFPAEYEVAKEIRKIISDEMHVTIPENEVYYLTVLLVSLRDEQAQGKVGVIVATHGQSTASSMTSVVEELLDIEKINSIDMPLDMPPQTAYERIKQAVIEVDEGNGVLLLVDMGSLSTFGEKLMEETGISVRTIDMVSTAVVLEAVRKASLVDTDLNTLFESLKKFRGYVDTVNNKPYDLSIKNKKKQIILAVCASGEGTAQRIKELVESALDNNLETNLSVIACSVAELKEKREKLKKDFSIVATTGILNPKLDAPFIPLEQFIEQDVEVVLKDIISQNSIVSFTPEVDEGNAKRLCQNFIEESYTFINPAKVIDPLWISAKEFYDLSDEREGNYAFHINLIMHLAGVVERTVLNETLTIDSDLEQIKRHPLYSEIKKVIIKLEKQLNIKIAYSEYYYLYHYLENGSMVDELDEIDSIIED